jgi:hypothetical protein
MAKCGNCGATLTCGCQKRMLPNGKSGCTKCINQLKNGNNTAPTVNSVNVTK